MLYFISSNKNKLDRAAQYLTPLGILFQSKDLDLLELQSESIEEIATYKAHQAFATLKQPLLVSDHGWAITALHGFPGAYMKYMNKWLTPEDFLTLMKDKDDREMIFTEYLCYTDGAHTKTFSQQIKGHVLFEPRGEGEPWMMVSSFTPDNQSVAEKLTFSPSAIANNEPYAKFAAWYQNLKS